MINNGRLPSRPFTSKVSLMKTKIRKHSIEPKFSPILQIRKLLPETDTKRKGEKCRLQLQSYPKYTR